MQRERGPDQSSDQLHSQVRVAESPKKTHEEYIQLNFIQSLNSDRIPVFEASLRRSNDVVKMSQRLPHINLSTV